MRSSKLKYILWFFLGTIVLIIGLKVGTRAKTGGPYQLVAQASLDVPVERWFFFEEWNVAFTREALIWVNASGEYKRVMLPRNTVDVRFSPSGRYYALLWTPTLSGAPGGQRKGFIELYHVTDGRRFQETFTRSYDEGFPIMRITDDGWLFVLQNTTARLRLFGPRGDRIPTGSLFPDAAYDLERQLDAVVIPGKNRLVVAANRHGMKRSGAQPHLLLLGPKGGIVWRRAIPAHGFTRLIVAPDGQWFALGVYRMGAGKVVERKTLVYDQRGQKVAETDLLMKYGQFSSAARFLVLAENARARLITIPAGTVLWEYSLPSKATGIAAVEIHPAGEAAALLMARSEFQDRRFHFVEPRLLLLNRDGEVFQELNFSGRRFLSPALRFAPTGEFIQIGFQQEKQTYRLQ